MNERIPHPNSQLHCIHGVRLAIPCRYCDPAERYREYDEILDRAVPSRGANKKLNDTK